MWTVVGRISPAGRRRAHNKSSISSTIRPSLQPAGGFTNNLFCLFVCVVVYFCVFLYLRIRVFAFCVVYLCICTYFCIRIHISVCVSVHLCICICATTFVWSVYVSLYLCVLSWWAEDRSSFSRVRPSLQPALGFFQFAQMETKGKHNIWNNVSIYEDFGLSILGGFGENWIRFFLVCESKSEFLLN